MSKKDKKPKEARMTESQSLLALFEGAKEHRDILAHPVLKCFLKIKWARMMWIFHCQFFLYLIFSSLLTAHTFLAFGGSVPSNLTTGNQLSGDDSKYVPEECNYTGFALVFISVLLILWEVLQMYRNARSYFKNFENHVQIFLIILTLAIIIIQWTGFVDDFKSNEHLRHLAALCIISTWTVQLFMLGRYPR